MLGPKLVWANAKTVIADFRRFGWLRVLCVLSLLGLLTVVSRLQGFPAGPRTSGPELKIPLEPIGFLPPAARMLAGGGPLFTLNYVDDTHLLFTYYTRGLLPRLPDATPDDSDGLVAGVLLELPSGKVLARTQWRMRDRDQYLWSIGHGRFLVRIRSRLVLLNPMGKLGSGDAFEEEPFGTFARQIGFITTSPGGDLLIVETVPPPKPRLIGGAASAAALAATQSPKPKPEPAKPDVQVFFFRMVLDQKPGQPEVLQRRSAGVVAALNLISVPANAEGFLSTSQESRGVYLFDFHTHDGKNAELSPYETTCAPHPFFVSRSEFIAFGCHGADKPQIGGFNLKGEHAWIEVLSNDHLSPLIVSAPAAGRFALSRMTFQGGLIDPQNAIPQGLAAQEITVRQNHDGRMLLKILADPVQRPAQNFDLSPDGLSLAVLRTGNIEVYRLPALSGKDVTALKLAAAMEPAKNDARVMLDSKPMVPASHSAPAPAVSAASDNSASGGDTGAGVAHITSQPSTPAVLPTPKSAGDATASENVPVEHRKPPSLYGTDQPKGADGPDRSGPPAPPK